MEMTDEYRVWEGTKQELKHLIENAENMLMVNRRFLKIAEMELRRLKDEGKAPRNGKKKGPATWSVRRWPSLALPASTLHGVVVRRHLHRLDIAQQLNAKGSRERRGDFKCLL